MVSSERKSRYLIWIIQNLGHRDDTLNKNLNPAFLNYWCTCFYWVKKVNLFYFPLLVFFFGTKLNFLFFLFKMIWCDSQTHFICRLVSYLNLLYLFVGWIQLYNISQTHIISVLRAKTAPFFVCKTWLYRHLSTERSM